MYNKPYKKLPCMHTLTATCSD